MTLLINIYPFQIRQLFWAELLLARAERYEVERIFQNREIANNNFSINGKKIDFSKITDVNVMTVEGGKDDISAPGQCYAALALCTGLKDNKKSSYVSCLIFNISF